MGVPVHPFATGVMVKVTVTGELVVLVNTPEILPAPLPAIPVTEPLLFLAQLKVVAPTAPLNAMGIMDVPEQIVWETGVATAFGLGLTNTVALLVQVLEVAVMVNVTYTGTAAVLFNTPLIAPDPLVAIPVMAVALFLVQVYVVPPPPPLSAILDILVPEHTVCAPGVATTTLAVGLTSTVAVTTVPAQPFAVGVIEKVTVTGDPVVFVNIPVMVPVPLAAIPVTEAVLVLVQL
jgi:hypothetical protein